jgi:hypothetical protein
MSYVHFSFILIWDAILTIAGSQRTRPEPRNERVRSCRFSSKRADKAYFRPSAPALASRENNLVLAIPALLLAPLPPHLLGPHARFPANPPAIFLHYIPTRRPASFPLRSHAVLLSGSGCVRLSLLLCLCPLCVLCLHVVASQRTDAMKSAMLFCLLQIRLVWVCSLASLQTHGLRIEGSPFGSAWQSIFFGARVSKLLRAWHIDAISVLHLHLYLGTPF